MGAGIRYSTVVRRPLSPKHLRHGFESLEPAGDFRIFGKAQARNPPLAGARGFMHLKQNDKKRPFRQGVTKKQPNSMAVADPPPNAKAQAFVTSEAFGAALTFG